MTDARSLLLVEDDRDLGSMLARLLRLEGYDVTHVRDGAAALQHVLRQAPDVIVLDRRLPDGDGLDVLPRMRRGGCWAPVLVLSAYSTTDDRVQGLDAGAQDYLVKPFEMVELAARLRALLHRPGQDQTDLRVPGGRLDVAGYSVAADDGSHLDLSRSEALLLETLARRPRQVFTRSDLVDRVFSGADGDSIVDTYVYYLRRKLGADVVKTVRGVGYRLGDLS